VGRFGGEDVSSSSEVEITDEQLYRLIAEDDVSEHTLELTVEEGQLQSFTFTFG